MTWRWKLRGYVDRPGSDVVTAWYANASKAARATFKVRLRYLLQSSREEWVRPRYAPLRKECRGLGEVRFKADNVEHRPIGFVDVELMEFTIVLFTIEKGGKFTQKDACKIAQARKREAQADRSRTRECHWIRD